MRPAAGHIPPGGEAPTESQISVLLLSPPPRAAVHVEPAGGGGVDRGAPREQPRARQAQHTLHGAARRLGPAEPPARAVLPLLSPLRPSPAKVRVPSETKAKDVKCAIKANSIEVVVSTLLEAQREVLKGTLFQTVATDESSWTIANVDGGRVLQARGAAGAAARALTATLLLRSLPPPTAADRTSSHRGSRRRSC